MAYGIRPATVVDIAHIAAHREGMFRDMGIDADFEGMDRAMRAWLATAIPDGTYRGWIAETAAPDVVAGAGLIVVDWPPGPASMDPRCGFVFNVYTEPAHRGQGLARSLMDAMHDWCRREGIERVVLNASRFGQSLYESMGYVISDEPMMRLRL